MTHVRGSALAQPLVAHVGARLNADHAQSLVCPVPSRQSGPAAEIDHEPGLAGMCVLREQRRKHCGWLGSVTVVFVRKAAEASDRRCEPVRTLTHSRRQYTGRAAAWRATREIQAGFRVLS